jgi:hypothetical protein
MTHNDPMVWSAEIDHEAALPVLGIDTRFESNSAFVMDVVEESFGRWRALPTADRSDSAPVRVRVVVHEGAEETATRTPISHISGPGKRLLLKSHGSVGIVDPSRRESVAHVSSELAADRQHFQVVVLEAITLALLACFDRHPLHAAGITRGKRTALLAGPSGSGKSTLAYLAHSAGIDVLSDDHVWVQLDPVCRVWGSAPHACLLSDAAAHFPEVVHPGPDKVAVHLPSGDDALRLVADDPVVCILARGDRAALAPMASREIETELIRQLRPGFDRFPERNAGVVKKIAKLGGWRLTLSANPRDALPLLQRILDGKSAMRVL